MGLWVDEHTVMAHVFGTLLLSNLLNKFKTRLIYAPQMVMRSVRQFIFSFRFGHMVCTLTSLACRFSENLLACLCVLVCGWTL